VQGDWYWSSSLGDVPDLGYGVSGGILGLWRFAYRNSNRASSIPKPFLLSLDNSVSVPVALKDVSSAHNPHLEIVVSGSSAGPPGKLYTSHAANALLETLETGGSCARLVPGETATSEERRMFDAFCTKLGEGGLVRCSICEYDVSADILISSL